MKTCPTDYDTPFEMFAETSYFVIDRRIRDRDWISGEELVEVIRANVGRPTPEFFSQYLADRAAGKIQRKRGPKPPNAQRRLAITVACDLLYPRYLKCLKWSQKRSRLSGIHGSRYSGRASCRQDPPHELAARMVCKRMGKRLPVSYRRLLNIISEKKRGRSS
jgi:hypothetical protein